MTDLVVYGRGWGGAFPGALVNVEDAHLLDMDLLMFGQVAVVPTDEWYEGQRVYRRLRPPDWPDRIRPETAAAAL